MIMKTKLFTPIFLLMVFLTVTSRLSAQSDPQIVWENTIGGVGDESPISTFATADGGFITAGGSTSGISVDKTEAAVGGSDYWIVKFAADGTIQWQNTIGGSTYDQATSIQQTTDGGYIVGGISLSNISGDKTENGMGDIDYWVLKLDNTGTIQWQNTVGGSGADYLEEVKQTPDGGFIIGGYSNSRISGDKSEDTIGSYDYWVVKLNSLGVIQWDQTLGGRGLDIFRDIAIANDGGILVGGYSSSNISADKSENNIGNEDYWIVKLDAAGNRLWDNTIGGIYGDVLSIVRSTSDHGFILGGHSASDISVDKTEPNTGDNDYWIVKIDSTGAIQWQNTIGGTGFDKLGALEPTSDGGYIVGGNSNSGVGGDKSETNYGSLDYWVLKLDALGNIIWQNTLNSDGIEDLTSIQQTTDGGYVISGSTQLATATGDKSEGVIGGYDFWEVKLKDPSRIVSGNVFADFNHNCTKDATDKGIQHIIVTDQVYHQYAITDTGGNYRLSIFGDTTKIYVVNLATEDSIACLPSDTLSIYTGGASAFDTTINFPIQASIFCHHLTVNISSNSIRRCSSRSFTVTYDNVGFDTAHAAFIIVEIDTAVVGAITSSTGFTQIGDTLIFPLGDIAPVTSSSINFHAFIKCEAVLGSSVCARAYIYPLNNCVPISPSYDGSDVEVTLTCSNDTVLAKVKNKADSHDMSHQGIITAIEDEIIQRIDTFILPAGSTTILRYVPAADKTLTLEVRQDVNHPERPIIITQDELCALTTPVKMNSVVNSFSRHDEADEYEEICMPIVGSYDPNLKSVSPQGITNQHYTAPHQLLEYRIDFQNTGTDTAFKVVVIDTLSSWLDLTTFVPLVSSSPCKAVMEGASTIKFIFDPIVLPDSNASEENSHGYITFKIKPKANTPKGTIINNFADIYFDANTPVRTNTAFNMIYDTIWMKIGVGISETPASLPTAILVFPNPAWEHFFIQCNANLNQATIKLTDIAGREVFQQSGINGSTVEIPAEGLIRGVYFVTISENNKVMARTKVILQ